VTSSMSLVLANEYVWSYQWIFYTSMLILWCLPSLFLATHIRRLRMKVENTKSKFQKVTYQQKCGFLCYKNVVYRSNFHPKSSYDSDCNPSKDATKSCWLLLSSHLYVDGVGILRGGGEVWIDIQQFIPLSIKILTYEWFHPYIIAFTIS